MAQTLKYVIGKDYRPLTVLEAKGGNIFTPDYDKSNWVQARQYEDNLRQVFVEITNEDGSAYDLTGANVLFEGILPDNEHKILDNSHVVFYEDPTTGKFRFDMPAQAFSIAGQYKQAFFRVVKDYRNIATLEFKFEVLADMVVTGLVPRDYISPLDDLFNTIKETETKNVAELKKIVDDKINEITDLMTTLNQTNTATLGELNSAKTALEALEEKIKKDGLFTQGEAEEFKNSFIKILGNLSEFKPKGDSLVSKTQNELNDRGINVKWFGAKGDGQTDDTDAFKRTFDYVVENFGNVSSTIIIPEGKYLISDTITLPPYITVKPIGIVHLISKLSDDDKPLIWIDWPSNTPTDMLNSKSELWGSQTWQRTLISDDSGVLNLLGNNKQSTGIEIGYRSVENSTFNNWNNFARSVLRKINISNFKVGIMMNPINLFLLNFENLNISKNITNVQIGNVDRDDFSSKNSGESINFSNSIFANADIGIDMQYGGVDINFFGCAFDFNKVALKGCEYANNNINIVGGNIEGNDRIYDGSLALTHQTYMASMTLSSPTILVHKNAESVQFIGRLTLYLNNPYISVSDKNSDKTLGNGQLLNKLIDENVMISSSRNISSGRNAKPVVIAERENQLAYGSRLSSIAYEHSNSNVKLLSKGDPDYSFNGFDLSGSILYKRPTDGTDNLGWTTISFPQKISVQDSDQYYVYSLAKINTKDIRTYKYVVTFYDYSDKVVFTDNLAVSIQTADLNRVGSYFSQVKNIPLNASYAKLSVGIGSLENGESVEIGYVRFVSGR
ncbi:Minor capsid protein [Ligilactobacillus salivarius]|uniref:BppU family phage baseplate upper protein n=1 Tax=Ligilactobacillus salivarius TaxID=1624 RepID=UPI0013DDDE22|nr:BppU family phage baseplate upper protein [Ligilactobacillus salivarius]QIG36205.1 Minor capsid protein [Ligilactobacillus salivarius]